MIEKLETKKINEARCVRYHRSILDPMGPILCALCSVYDKWLEPPL